MEDRRSHATLPGVLSSLLPHLVPRPTRVLLADKPGFARTALAALLAETPGLELELEPRDGTGIGQALAEHRPDVLVIDDRLIDGGLPELAPGVRVIVVGVGDDPGYAVRAERLGAAAWVPKDRADLLVQAVLGEPLPLRRSPTEPDLERGRVKRAAS
jgi:hypothetical protein